MKDSTGCGLPQSARRGDWMQTYSGVQYWPLNPQTGDVRAVDIAHHLSMLCRYCGACRRFYSVLEHSLGVLYVGRRQLRRLNSYYAGVPSYVLTLLLLHDAAEAYCHDVIRPIKRCIDGYEQVEAANFAAICARFDLPPVAGWLHRLIKAADNAMLLAEQALLMGKAPASWAPIDVPPAMRTDALAWLKAARWKPWRRWRWWQKREFARYLEQFGVTGGK